MTSSAPGVSSKSITLGYITSLTGVASSSFADGAAGAIARIDLQNAAGGVDGRQIKLVAEDDESSPTQDATAAEDLVQQKHVFGVIDYSSFTYGGSPYLQKQGVPVAGFAFDGPEWAEQPNTNMFSYLPPVDTAIGGVNYSYDYEGAFLKSIGITKVAAFAYGISPSATESAKSSLAAAQLSGIGTCLSDLTVPFGGVDFTASALAMKAGGCNGATTALVDSSDIALAQAIKNEGLKTKLLISGTGYDQAVLASPSASKALDGDYMASSVLFDPSIPGIATMFSALKKYDPKYTAGTIPDYGLYGSYIAADLMIKGLEEAGKNPTRPSFITNLRKVTSYNAGGILPSPTSFANFGTVGMVPPTGCEYFVQLTNGKYVNALGGTKTLCGKRFKVPS